MKNIILLGKPGSGKGTIAKALEQDGYYILGGSNILRENSQSPSAKYYKEAKHALDTGILISSELINQMVSEKVKEIGKDIPIVFDGYPRTVEQAEHLVSLFPKESLAVYLMEVDNDTLIERILNRLSCLDCSASFNKVTLKPKKDGICDHCNGELYQRVDDNKETLATRMKEYTTKTLPILQFFEDQTITIPNDYPNTLDLIKKNL